MPEALVGCELNEHVGTLTLQHEARRNALSAELVRQLIAALARLRDGQARVAILRARPGVSVFSAGHDVNELPLDGRDPLTWDDPLRHLIREIENFPAPVIAMVEGGVWGGACEAVLACDLIVAAPGASFAATPARLGVPYNVSGMLTFLNAAGMRIVKEMVFTAKPVSAERAERVGLINHLVPAAEIEAFTLELARTIAGNAPLSVAVMKEQLRILAGAHPMTPQGFERVQGLRRLVYDSQDYQEGVRAFLEKRTPQFHGR